jgi:hypothetical protein
MAIRTSIRSRRSTGATSTRSGPRPVTTRASAAPRRLFFDYWRQHRLRIKVARIFNTYGPRMHPNDGRVVSNFIMQALRADDHDLRRRPADALVLLRRRPHRRHHRLMESADEVTGPINLGNPAEFTIRELAEIVIDTDRIALQDRQPAAARRRSAPAPARHREGAPGAGVDAAHAAQGGLVADHCLFRGAAAGGRRTCLDRHRKIGIKPAAPTNELALTDLRFASPAAEVYRDTPWLKPDEHRGRSRVGAGARIPGP